MSRKQSSAASSGAVGAAADSRRGLSVVFQSLLAGVMGVGTLIGWAACLAGAALILAVPAMVRKGGARRVIAWVFTGIFAGAVAWCGYLSTLIFSAVENTPPNSATVIVLGCLVSPNGEPSLSLENRIQKAAEYLQAHPEAVCIVSGGQGSLEPVSEASVMARELEELGIDSGRILQEDRLYRHPGKHGVFGKDYRRAGPEPGGGGGHRRLPSVPGRRTGQGSGFDALCGDGTVVILSVSSQLWPGAGVHDEVFPGKMAGSFIAAIRGESGYFPNSSPTSPELLVTVKDAAPFPLLHGLGFLRHAVQGNLPGTA